MEAPVTTQAAPAAGQPAPPPAPGAGDNLPEKYRGKSVEDVARMHTELESKLGEYGSYKSVVDRLNQYGGVDNVLQWALHGAQQAQQQGSRSAPTASEPAPGDPWADWDLLPAREQAKRMQAVLKQELGATYTQQIAEYAKPYIQQVQQYFDQQNRQWDIYRKVMGEWRKNPGIDPDALLQTMVKLSTGGVEDLISLAARMNTGDLDAEKKAKALFESYKVDEETKQKNAAFAALTNGTPPVNLPPAPTTAEDAKALILTSLLRTGSITPGQI